MGAARRSAGQAVAVAAPVAARRGESMEVDPAFHRAILKIALELKKPEATSYDEIVERTIRAMKLDPVGFRRYLGENGARNMSLLLATARALGV
ncbi:hypothetical protein AMPC_34950 [Anaeromyxobacter paludicola]|uniref:Uncharacterized protein n=2 Tax=Anaeromyxobacter paludicola TaxID=2918171 RepID=A0ABN6NAY0_9BACT|nr:hypothetical protein AMPC_34950 [Anaeromyxobacter paludicola]